MTTAGFVKAVSLSSALPVYLLRASDETHGACWYYLEVDYAKHGMFRKISGSGRKFTLTDFGRIISSGWGDNPPQATIELLRCEGIIES